MTIDRSQETRKYAAPAVDRMLDIVEFLSHRRRAYGISELARELEIPTNSVFRILRRLDERGYVEEDPASGRYQLSTRFFSLGMRLSARFDLRLRARPHLEQLSRDTGETAQLHVLDGGEAIALDVANAAADYFLQVVPGTRLQLHCNAFGKCILAFLDEQDVRAILPARMPRRTKSTITERARLLEQLEDVRATGLAYDWEEYNPGVFCIGAPVFDVNDTVAAGMGMTGLVGRYNAEQRKPLEAAVLGAAAAVSRHIGFEGSFFIERGASLEKRD